MDNDKCCANCKFFHNMQVKGQITEGECRFVFPPLAQIPMYHHWQRAWATSATATCDLFKEKEVDNG